jgi:hypothetical protein
MLPGISVSSIHHISPSDEDRASLKDVGFSLVFDAADCLKIFT